MQRGQRQVHVVLRGDGGHLDGRVHEAKRHQIVRKQGVTRRVQRDGERRRNERSGRDVEAGHQAAGGEGARGQVEVGRVARGELHGAVVLGGEAVSSQVEFVAAGGQLQALVGIARGVAHAEVRHAAGGHHGAVLVGDEPRDATVAVSVVIVDRDVHERGSSIDVIEVPIGHQTFRPDDIGAPFAHRVFVLAAVGFLLGRPFAHGVFLAVLRRPFAHRVLVFALHHGGVQLENRFGEVGQILRTELPHLGDRNRRGSGQPLGGQAEDAVVVVIPGRDDGRQVAILSRGRRRGQDVVPAGVRTAG